MEYRIDFKCQGLRNGYIKKWVPQNLFMWHSIYFHMFIFMSGIKISQLLYLSVDDSEESDDDLDDDDDDDDDDDERQMRSRPDGNYPSCNLISVFWE